MIAVAYLAVILLGIGATIAWVERRFVRPAIERDLNLTTGHPVAGATGEPRPVRDFRTRSALTADPETVDQ